MQLTICLFSSDFLQAFWIITVAYVRQCLYSEPHCHIQFSTLLTKAYSHILSSILFTKAQYSVLYSKRPVTISYPILCSQRPIIISYPILYSQSPITTSYQVLYLQIPQPHDICYCIHNGPPLHHIHCYVHKFHHNILSSVSSIQAPTLLYLHTVPPVCACIPMYPLSMKFSDQYSTPSPCFTSQLHS